MGTAQNGFTANYPHALDEQSRHLSHIIGHAEAKGIGVIEATEEAEADWVRTIVDKARLGLKFFEECTPGYYNNEGKPGERNGQNANYGGGPVEFFSILEEWRERGDFAGLELTRR